MKTDKIFNLGLQVFKAGLAFSPNELVVSATELLKLIEQGTPVHGFMGIDRISQVSLNKLNHTHSGLLIAFKENAPVIPLTEDQKTIITLQNKLALAIRQRDGFPDSDYPNAVTLIHRMNVELDAVK